MKKILILIIISASFSFAQGPDKESKEKSKEQKALDDSVLQEELSKKLLEEAKERKKHTHYIAKFIQKEYVEKNEKLIPGIEAKIIALNKRIAVTNNPSTKKRYLAKKKELKVELEVAKMWKIFHKAYVVSHEAAQQNKSDVHVKALLLMRNVRKRHKELTAKSFPDPIVDFYNRYGNKLKEANKKAN